MLIVTYGIHRLEPKLMQPPWSVIAYVTRIYVTRIPQGGKIWQKAKTGNCHYPTWYTLGYDLGMRNVYHIVYHIVYQQK